ncbi:MAG: hypothetical protein AAGF20_00145 [Pseudomonadota bacterium]
MLKLLCAATLSLCVSACASVPLVRTIDTKLSGLVLGHLYPPRLYLTNPNLNEPDLWVQVPGYQVASECAEGFSGFAKVQLPLMMECVFKRDGQIIAVVPNDCAAGDGFCDLMIQHARGHVYQFQMGLPTDHKGWGRTGLTDYWTPDADYILRAQAHGAS